MSRWTAGESSPGGYDERYMIEQACLSKISAAVHLAGVLVSVETQGAATGNDDVWSTVIRCGSGLELSC